MCQSYSLSKHRSRTTVVAISAKRCEHDDKKALIKRTSNRKTNKEAG